MRDEFDGITLYLSNAAFGRDFPDDEKGRGAWDREMLTDTESIDKAYLRTMMRMARAVGFGEYIPRTVNKLVADGYIHFPKTVPFYIVVAVTGFFRAWDGNHESLHKVYTDLIKAGVEPYTALCASQGIHKDRYATYTTYIVCEHITHTF